MCGAYSTEVTVWVCLWSCYIGSYGNIVALGVNRTTTALKMDIKHIMTAGTVLTLRIIIPTRPAD